MIYVVLDQLQKVVAWSNKCGGCSIRSQILKDLNDPTLDENIRLTGMKAYDVITNLFTLNPRPNLIPKDYKFDWYVRDPFYRILSCFINRKIIIENSDPEITFRDFIFNLDYFRSKSLNIRGHSELQVKDYFEAPWNIIDINNAIFTIDQKYNTTQYTLGNIDAAWNIPSQNLVIDNQTYSQLSFYSKEIMQEVGRFYREDYNFLVDKIQLLE